MSERHYHVHYRQAIGSQEECAGDHDRYESARVEVDHLDHLNVPFVMIANLPYCLYGPNDEYQIMTYCVGRGVRHDAQ